jgi:hypothetical protein
VILLLFTEYLIARQSQTNGYIMTIFISVNKHSECGRIQHYHYFAATKQRNQTKSSHMHETQTFFNSGN